VIVNERVQSQGFEIVQQLAVQVWATRKKSKKWWRIA